MKRGMIFLLALLLVPKVWAAQVACPRFTPAAWGVGQMPLESVRVLSYPISTVPGADRDYYATPPWEEREKAGFIYQTWHMNHVDEFKYEVDCIYAGIRRYFNMDLTGVSLCMARWRARRDHGVTPLSLDFRCKK